MTDEALKGPYIVWEDYGCEGWHPKSYATAREALTDTRYQRFILTKVLVFEIIEDQSDQRISPAV